MKVMNGKHLGGEQIRVDFLRSQSTKRDSLVDYGQFQTRQQHAQPLMGRDYQPSNILWIGFPPSFQIDEQMIHNAMILFGEIEKIKSFPSRNYSFVAFRSVDEARRAKEGLQGRLFNDPRITIMYSSSDLVLGNEHPLRPQQVDVFGHDRPMVPNNFPGQLPPGGGPNVPMQPFGPQGHESRISGPEFNEMGTHHKFQDVSSKSQMGPNWKRPSSTAPGILPSPVAGIRPPTRSTSGAWDVLDANQIHRDSKRLRTDGALLFVGGGSGPKSHLGPVGSGITAGVAGSDIDHIWRGVIAKGGTPICRARCVPIGKEIGTELPNVVDCAARIGLDMLTKHYADAIGFDIVFFLPDSKDDFASYTEFLRYLKAINCAGVAEFADNTTLFLVPPSDFLTKVLKVAGSERLYGVVFKFPQVPGSAQMQQSMHFPLPSTQYMQQIPPTQAEYGSISGKEEQNLPLDYNRLLHEESKLPAKPLHPTTGGTPSVNSAPLDDASANTSTASQAAVTLTPELIASLTSLFPMTTQSSATIGGNAEVSLLTVKPPFPPVAPNHGNQSHLWKQDHQIVDPHIHPSQQFGSTYNIHSAQHQFYPPASASNLPAQVFSATSSSHFQDTAASLQLLGSVSSRPIQNFTVPCQSGQVPVSPLASQQYQVEIPPSTQRGYGVVQGTDASISYNDMPFQQPSNFIASTNQFPCTNASHQQTVAPYTVGKVNLEPSNQQFQPSFFGVDQGISELEADKNQRYQSTLQLASNLLQQIQQQQTPGGHGPENQQ